MILGSRWAVVKRLRFEVARTIQKNQRKRAGFEPVVRSKESQDDWVAEVKPRNSVKPRTRNLDPGQRSHGPHALEPLRIQQVAERAQIAK